MPEIRHYTVTQTRKVRVSANSAADAAQIASVAFDSNGTTENGNVIHGRGPHGIWGNTSGAIQEIDMRVVRDG
jgi:hypothetical protein